MPDQVKIPDNLAQDVPPRIDKKSTKEQKDLFREKRAKVIGNIFLWGVRIAAISIGIMFIVRVYHFVAPNCAQWLCEHQIEDLDRFLFSGAIGALVGKYFDEAFGGNKLN